MSEAGVLRLPYAEIDDLDVSNSYCAIIKDAFDHSYVPDGYIIVGNDFYLSGRIEHQYGVKIGGEAAASMEPSKIVEVLRSVPILSGIADYFNFGVEVEVGGKSIESDKVAMDFGQNTVITVGFRPMFVREERVDLLVDSVYELPDGIADISGAVVDPESARAFLEMHPEFDLENGESLMYSVFSGEGLLQFDKFVEIDSERATRFSYTMSLLIELNKQAGRLSGF